MIAPKKIYCIDTGIIHSVAFKFSEDFGRVMENLVTVDLLRRASYAYESSTEVYYWKDHQHHEVDFVLKKGSRVEQLIQVTAASSSDEIREREFLSLLKASKDLRCDSLVIITWDYEAQETKDGQDIQFIPLWKWLLTSESPMKKG